MRNSNRREIKGIIKQDDLIVTFVGIDHHFVFLPIDSSKSADEYGISGVHTGNLYGILKPENCFLQGRTYEGNEVLIFCREELRLQPTNTLDTWLYIVSSVRDPLNKYSGIEFIGGSMNSVFFQNSFHPERMDSKENNSYLTDDHKDISINVGNIKQINFGSGVAERYNRKRGNKVENTGVIFHLIFKEMEDIRSTFQRNYNDIVTLLQFMTFRQNVVFKEVNLLSPAEYEGRKMYEQMAKCYVLNDLDQMDNIPHNDDELYKYVRDDVRCITFDSLSVEETVNLYRLIAHRNDAGSQFVVNFIPCKKEMVHIITNQQIRDVCTSIEKEAAVLDIKAEHSEGFANVIKSIKQIIKTSRKSKDRLTDREYSYIETGLNHWRAPAVELAKKLFDMQKENIMPILNDAQRSDLTIDEIKTVITLRNNLTHSGDSKAEDNVGDITLILMAVVYSSILSRCGCDKELIQKVMGNGLLTAAD